MRFVFLGATGFGLRCLDVLGRASGVEVVGVVSAPRTFNISYRPQGVTNILHADFDSYCTERKIDIAMLTDGMADQALYDRFAGWRPDAMLVAGWYHMVPRKWRALAAAYGLHASLLPDYSGGAPLVWAMINGETRTGITLFQLADGVDDGPIVDQAAADISPDDTIATLYARIEDLGVELVERNAPLIAHGRNALIVQDEGKRRIVPQRSPEDGAIDWSQSTRRILDFIRAQTRPYPGAFTFVDGRKLHVWAARSGSVVASPSDPTVEAGGAFRFTSGDGGIITATDASWDDM